MRRCRKMALCLLTCAAALALSACGREMPEATTVYVDENGTLEQILVDASADYSADDLKQYARESIDACLKANEEADIELVSCRKEDGTVYLELSYGSSDDYTALNSMYCFLGTLEEAAAAGTAPEGTLLAADGSETDYASLLAEHPEYHMLILSENTLVQTDTAILCGTELVTITGESTAVIGDGDAGSSGYFPRKTDGTACLIFE